MLLSYTRRLCLLERVLGVLRIFTVISSWTSGYCKAMNKARNFGGGLSPSHAGNKTFFIVRCWLR